MKFHTITYPFRVFHLVFFLSISLIAGLHAQSFDYSFSEQHKSRSWNSRADFKVNLTNGNILVVQSFVKGSSKKRMLYDFILYDGNMKRISKHAYNNQGVQILQVIETDFGFVQVYELVRLNRSEYTLRIKNLDVSNFSFDNEEVCSVDITDFEFSIEIKKKDFVLISKPLYNTIIFSEDRSKWAFIYTIRHFDGSLFTKAMLFDSKNKPIKEWEEIDVQQEDFIDQALLSNEGVLLVKWRALYKKKAKPKYYFYNEDGVESFLANQVCARCFNFSVSLENGMFHFLDFDVNRKSRGTMKTDESMIEFDVDQNRLKATNIKRWNLEGVESIGNERIPSLRNIRFHGDYPLSNGDRYLVASTNVRAVEYESEGVQGSGMLTVFLIYKLSREGKMVWLRSLRQKHSALSTERYFDHMEEGFYKDSLVFLSRFTDDYKKDQRFLLDKYAGSTTIYAHFIGPDGEISTQSIDVSSYKDKNISTGSFERINENRYFLELNNNSHSRFRHMLIEFK